MNTEALLSSAHHNLTHFWGYPDFREGQAEAIKSVFERKDTMVLFPTGGGKSLCYQVPATVFKGLTLVISPLVALMQDQVAQLNDRGIPSAYINSTLPSFEIEQRLVNARNGMYKLLYCAPERLKTERWRAELNNLNIDLIAIDEAHCISEWGHDFRPSYRDIVHELSSLRGSSSWLALTATATPDVKKDMLEVLQFKTPNVVELPFSRPNLTWWVTSTMKKREKMIESVQRGIKQGDGLIYGGTRKNCEQWAARFGRMGIPAEAYHAGFSSEGRKEIQQRWINGETPLVAATNAFGMGIDKSDCRFVLHEQMPGSLEAYYQEAGRAGRDGKPAYPILFYKPSDMDQMEERVKQQYPDFNELERSYQVLCDMMQLAIGSTQAEARPFSVEDFRVRSTLSKQKVQSVLRIFQQYDIIHVQNQVPASVEVLFTMSSDNLATFKQRCNNPDKADFVDRLERLFGYRAFSNPISLPLQQVLDRLDLSVNALTKALNVLMSHDFVLQFLMFDERSLITLLESRQKNVPLSKPAIEQRFEMILTKLRHMNEYALTTECREVYLRTYFGDLDATPCGTCDNCIRKGRLPSVPSDSECNAVLELVKQGPVEAEQLSRQFSWAKQKTKVIVRFLINEGKLKPDPHRPGWLVEDIKDQTVN
ncbi:MAG: ATP-dependent DNA helicase RecQ [Bacteroidota bacterium]